MTINRTACYVTTVNFARIVTCHHTHKVMRVGSGHIGIGEIKVIDITRIIPKETASIAGGVGQITDGMVATVEISEEWMFGGTDTSRPLVDLERLVVIEFEETTFATSRNRDDGDATTRRGRVERGVCRIIIERVS